MTHLGSPQELASGGASLLIPDLCLVGTSKVHLFTGRKTLLRLWLCVTDHTERTFAYVVMSACVWMAEVDEKYLS